MGYSEIRFSESSDMLLTKAPEDTDISIYVNQCDLTIDDVINKLVRPMLSAIGFNSETIEEYIGEY